jgi:hypothetical protein
MTFPRNLDELRAQGYKYDGASNCRSCGADIEWWETPAHKKIPMDHGTAVACRKCWEARPFGRYLYGVVNAQEMKTGESEASDE